jgi:hypothetical protein
LVEHWTLLPRETELLNEQDWRDPVGLCGAAEVLSIGSVLSATSIGCTYGGGGIYRKAGQSRTGAIRTVSVARAHY